MSKFVSYVGYAWAFPVTLFGLIYVSVFTALRWYRWAGRYEHAWVWQLNDEKAPGWLVRAWARWGGHTVGQVVVIKDDISSPRTRLTLLHENVHVLQCMKLGVFWPVLYGLISLVIKVACPNSNPYLSNVFEVDARRKAGQLVDVEGLTQRMQARIKANSNKS